MVDRSVVERQLRLYLETPGGDVAHATELYHPDAVLEFPQSGERFEGRDGFTEWRSRYPAEVAFTVLRATVQNGLAVVELTASYDAGPPMFGVSVIEFVDDKIAHERIYVNAGWDAPEWRAPWRAASPAEAPGW